MSKTVGRANREATQRARAEPAVHQRIVERERRAGARHVARRALALHQVGRGPGGRGPGALGRHARGRGVAAPVRLGGGRRVRRPDPLPRRVPPPRERAHPSLSPQGEGGARSVRLRRDGRADRPVRLRDRAATGRRDGHDVAGLGVVPVGRLRGGPQRRPGGATARARHAPGPDRRRRRDRPSGGSPPPDEPTARAPPCRLPRQRPARRWPPALGASRAGRRGGPRVGHRRDGRAARSRHVLQHVPRGDSVARSPLLGVAGLRLAGSPPLRGAGRGRRGDPRRQPAPHLDRAGPDVQRCASRQVRDRARRGGPPARRAGAGARGRRRRGAISASVRRSSTCSSASGRAAASSR